MPNNEEIEKNSTEPVKDPAPAQDKPDFADDVEKWKHFSRENENRASENYRKLQESEKHAGELDEKLTAANGELHASRMENAKLKAMLKHPQLTQEVFDSLFKGDDPDEVESWAEQAARLIPMPSSEPAGEDPEPQKKPTATQATKHIIDGAKGEGMFRTAPVKGEAYKRAMERQQARQKKN